MNRWKFLLDRFTDQLWFRAALYAALGVAAALVAAALAPLIPPGLAKPFGGRTVNELLDVLAASLLGVATFSVTALLAAFTNVSQNATPRAARLIADNRRAQGALSTFVGAFLYAVVGYSALGTGFYDERGQAILFFITLVMLVVVAVTLLRWLDQLLRLVRVDNIIGEVEREAAAAMRSAFGSRPTNPAPAPAPDDGGRINAHIVGFVQNVDLGALRRIASDSGLRIWIEATPGSFTVANTVLARTDRPFDAPTGRRLRGAFTIGLERSFAQDPRYGLIVLSEIGSHALSHAMNNPGIAKDVITSLIRVLALSMELACETGRPARHEVYWGGPDLAALLEDSFLAISKDGAATITVAIRLQQALAALRDAAPSPADRTAIERFAREALDRSVASLDHAPDRVRVRRAAGVDPS